MDKFKFNIYLKDNEYFYPINKIKDNNNKRELEEKIILFRKRIALEQFLSNVIIEIKNRMLNEKLKAVLVKKFIYTIIEKYIEHFNNENDESNSEKLNIIEENKMEFERYLLKNYFFQFIIGTNICLNNDKIRLIQLDFEQKQAMVQRKIYYFKLKNLPMNNYNHKKKIIMYKIFLLRIKNMMKNKKNIINKQIKNSNLVKSIILKNNAKFFFIRMKECIKDKKNIMKKYNENKSIFEIRKKNIEKYFKEFIKNIRIIKLAKENLKRKVFNIIKNNANISKDLKHYLSEADNIII